jgi:hypothetical protein
MRAKTCRTGRRRRAPIMAFWEIAPVTTPSHRRRYLTRPVRTPRNKPRESVSRTWAIWRVGVNVMLIRPSSNRELQVSSMAPRRIRRSIARRQSRGRSRLRRRSCWRASIRPRSTCGATRAVESSVPRTDQADGVVGAGPTWSMAKIATSLTCIEQELHASNGIIEQLCESQLFHSRSRTGRK